jgi:hypothetical protein
VEVLTDVPNRCVNLARSNLSFNIRIPRVDTKQLKLFTNGGGSLFSRISLYTRSGVYLSDITESDMFTRVVTPLLNSVEDLKSHDNNRASTTVTGAQSKGRGSMVAASNAFTTDAVVLGRNAQRPNADGSTSDAYCDSTEPEYITSSATGTALGGEDEFDGDLCLALSIPLRDLCPHTVMSLDKDLYFNQSLVLRTSFAPFTRIGSEATTSVGGAGDANFSNAPQISDFRLNLAVETNSRIAEGVRNMVMTTGLSVLCPYVYENTYASPPNATSVNQSVRYNISQGHSLLNIYSATANGITTRSAVRDIDNRAEAKVTSVQMSMDNNLLSEYRLEADKSLGYEAQRHLIAGSVSGQSCDVWKYNCTYVNSWRAGATHQYRSTDGIVDGLDLSSEKIFVVDKTVVPSANGYRNHIWAITQRKLSIAPSGDIRME